MDLVGCRPVAYWPSLARKVGGVKAAVMLSQLLYWNGDKSVQERGWILKSVEDLENETGLNKLEQQTARRILQNSGILVCKLHGVPRIWHYQVDADRLGEILIGTVSHPMGNPSNGKPPQRSAGNRPNVEPKTVPTFGGKPSQLKEESENTSLRLHTETTSSSSSKVDLNLLVQEEEEAPSLSPELLEELQAIGVYANLIPEIARSGFTEDQIFLMIDQAADAEPEPGKTAALLMYKIRNTPHAAKSIQTPEERDAENRRRYITGEYADIVRH